MTNHGEFAIALALRAGNIMRSNFVLGVEKTWKEDNGPLTKTDLAVNDLVISEVRRKFPDHGVLGEEKSFSEGREFLWVCDPIDGTNPFSHGYPTFLFSLALVKRGCPILGVLYDPILDRLVMAESGNGAYLNGRSKIRVDESPELARSLVALEPPDMSKFRSELLKKKCLVTTFYCITYSSLLVALGQFKAAIWSGKTPWDGAAVQIITEEAGGVCTDINGFRQKYDGPINGLVVSNKSLHPVLIEMIKNAS